MLAMVESRNCATEGPPPVKKRLTKGVWKRCQDQAQDGRGAGSFWPLTTKDATSKAQSVPRNRRAGRRCAERRNSFWLNHSAAPSQTSQAVTCFVGFRTARLCSSKPACAAGGRRASMQNHGGRSFLPRHPVPRARKKRHRHPLDEVSRARRVCRSLPVRRSAIFQGGLHQARRPRAPRKRKGGLSEADRVRLECCLGLYFCPRPCPPRP